MTHPRVKCGEEHGVVNFDFGRCYFLKTHVEEKRLTLCKSDNSFLAYPSCYREARFIFRSHLFKCPNCRDNMSHSGDLYLRVGVQKNETDDGRVPLTSSDSSHVSCSTRKTSNYSEASFFHASVRKTTHEFFWKWKILQLITWYKERNSS